MQLPQISRGGGSGAGSVVVVLDVVVGTGAVLLVVLVVVGATLVVVGAEVVVEVVMVAARVVDVLVVGGAVVVECLGLLVLVVVDARVVVVGARVVEVVVAGGAVVLVGDGWVVDVLVLGTVVDVACTVVLVVLVDVAAQPALRIATLQDAWSLPAFTARFATCAAQLTYAPRLRAGQHSVLACARTSATPLPSHAPASVRVGAAASTAKENREMVMVFIVVELLTASAVPLEGGVQLLRSQIAYAQHMQDCDFGGLP